MMEPNKHGVTHQIILIRHGQYINASEDEGRKLTPLGKEQAALTGKRVAELVKSGVVYPIKHVYYSTMTRATETGQLIIPSLLDSENVLSSCSFEPCSMIREGAAFPPVPPSRGWKPSPASFFKDNSRIEAAFNSHVHRAESDEEKNYSTVLVCHGNVIRYFVMRALQLPPSAWLRTAVFNSSITILEIGPTGNVSLRAFGDVGFLPADKVTYS